MSQKIIELQGLRAPMALGVLFFHICSISGYRMLGHLDATHMVSVAFALSGFVIAVLLDSSKESYWTFISRRFVRIFPAYAVCVILAALLISQGLMPKNYPDGTGLTHGILHATMLHGLFPESWFPGADGAFLNPAWSITVEWQFYLVIPLFFALLRRKPLLAWFLIIFIAAIARRFLRPELGLGGGSLLAHLQFFVYGIMSFFVYRWAGNNAERIGTVSYLLPMLLPLLLLPLIAVNQNTGLLIWLVFFGAIVSVHTNHALVPTRIVIDILRSRPFTWLGAISYSLYLVHEPVVWLTYHGIEYFIPGYSQTGLAFLLGVLAIPLAIAAAYVLNRTVELPCIRFANNYSSGRAQPLPITKELA